MNPQNGTDLCGVINKIVKFGAWEVYLALMENQQADPKYGQNPILQVHVPDLDQGIWLKALLEYV